MKIKLSEEQKQFIRDNFKETPNLLDLTKAAFKNDDLDGRSKEGRAVKKFLAEQSMDYKTTKWDKVEDIVLTEHQIEFVKQQAKNGLSAFQISEMIWPEMSVKRFSKQHVAVLDFLREYEPAYVHDSESAVNRAYSPPKLLSTGLTKINEFCFAGLKEEKLTHDDTNCIESLIKSLSAPRFIQVITC